MEKGVGNRRYYTNWYFPFRCEILIYMYVFWVNVLDTNNNNTFLLLYCVWLFGKSYQLPRRVFRNVISHLGVEYGSLRKVSSVLTVGHRRNIECHNTRKLAFYSCKRINKSPVNLWETYILFCVHSSVENYYFKLFKIVHFDFFHIFCMRVDLPSILFRQNTRWSIRKKLEFFFSINLWADSFQDIEVSDCFSPHIHTVQI